MQIYLRCLRCGRKLRNPEHQKMGYGPNCYLKIQQAQLKKKQLIIGEVEYVGQTKQVGSRKH